MNCPPDVADILLRILQAAALRIRAAGWSGNAPRCAAEADHIHNLPALLRDYSDEGLRFYWEVERPSFRAQSAGESLADLERLWGELRPHVPGAQGADPLTRSSAPVTAS